jgi:hypothetical protein
MTNATITVEAIVLRIHVVRGIRVLIDSDLAALYGVPTKRFNEAIKRHAARFPTDFMFQIDAAEFAALRSRFATSKAQRGGRRYLPHAFTEHGALMAAMILNSAPAVDVSVYVVRAFVQLRDLLAGNKELAHRLTELEERIEARLADQDAAITDILAAIRQLIAPPVPPRRPIGFISDAS